MTHEHDQHVMKRYVLLTQRSRGTLLSAFLKVHSFGGADMPSPPAKGKTPLKLVCTSSFHIDNNNAAALLLSIIDVNVTESALFF
ncbi:hypothetical protein HY409_03315 [Candidatus Gottesmanbacteria bacterium]|nr:hypothetical protein [Candidatus Gottesmanbacteria bacterium]